MMLHNLYALNNVCHQYMPPGEKAGVDFNCYVCSCSKGRMWERNASEQKSRTHKSGSTSFNQMQVNKGNSGFVHFISLPHDKAIESVVNFSSLT